MKYRVSELIGEPLDLAVAKAEDWKVGEAVAWFVSVGDLPPPKTPPYSTAWNVGGPIIERERIGITLPHDPGDWLAEDFEGFTQSGPTPLIAAMRAYVASKFGEEIELE